MAIKDRANFELIGKGNNFHYGLCKICGDIVFNKIEIKNWIFLTERDKKRTIIHRLRLHLDLYHEETEKISEKSLNFLKNFPLRKIAKKNKYRMKKIRKVPLKPWHDRESLFCDTKFLKELLGKEITECKDNMI